MTLRLTILWVLLAATVLPARALQFAWNPPPDFTGQGYFVFHGIVSGAYQDMWPAGTSTNFTVPTPLPLGNNYFVCTVFALTNGVMEMSAWSNEVVVTNVVMGSLDSVILSSTNLTGGWQPWVTNHLVLPMTNPNRFFRTGALHLSTTNQILPPIP